MQVLDPNTKFAHLGKPGTAFTPGFARRLAKIVQKIDLKDKKILDVGAGEGVWLGQFAQYTSPQNVYGTEYDPQQVVDMQDENSEVRSKYHIPRENIINCPAERLDFVDNSFDIVFSNEVLEHVNDDRKAVSEAIRVLKPGGKFIVFTPNRGWPFEQHGMFLKGKYYWGNIPLLPWFPWLGRIFAPHVRNYGHFRIRALFKGLPIKVVSHDYVFPAFDRLSRKWGLFGKIIQKFFHLIENTPLKVFGISHFLIVEKLSSNNA